MPSVPASVIAFPSCEVAVAPVLPVSTGAKGQSAPRLCVHDLHRLM